MITREQACNIAKKEARSRQFGFELLRVINVSKEVRSGIGAYADLGNCWMAYIKDIDTWTIQPSIIMAIDKTNGQVTYSGSARDEG